MCEMKETKTNNSKITGVQHKAWGTESVLHRFQSGLRDGFGKCEGVNTFLFKFLFKITSLKVFPADIELPTGIQNTQK